MTIGGGERLLALTRALGMALGNIRRRGRRLARPSFASAFAGNVSAWFVSSQALEVI